MQAAAYGLLQKRPDDNTHILPFLSPLMRVGSRKELISPLLLVYGPAFQTKCSTTVFTDEEHFGTRKKLPSHPRFRRGWEVRGDAQGNLERHIEAATVHDVASDVHDGVGAAQMGLIARPRSWHKLGAYPDTGNDR